MACLEVFCISILMLWLLVCPDTGLKPELQSILITIDVVALLAFVVMRYCAERAYSLPDEAYSPPDEAYSPPDEAHSPTDEAHSPTDEAHSPTDEAHSPTDKAYSPTDKAYPPRDKAYSPSEDIITFRRLVQLFFIAVAIFSGIVLVPGVLYVFFSIVIEWLFF